MIRFAIASVLGATLIYVAIAALGQNTAFEAVVLVGVGFFAARRAWLAAAFAYAAGALAAVRAAESGLVAAILVGTAVAALLGELGAMARRRLLR